MVYKAREIRTHRSVGMTVGGMVLFALLTGGDYDKVDECTSFNVRQFISFSRRVSRNLDARLRMDWLNAALAMNFFVPSSVEKRKVCTNSFQDGETQSTKN